MRELLVETREVRDEEGSAHELSYYVLIGEMAVEGRFCCESYGVKVAERGGDESVVPDITVSIARIDGLMELLLRNAVSPAGLRDMLDDWL